MKNHALKYARWAALSIAGLIAAITCIGWMLPVGHAASRTMHVRASPESVFDLVKDVAAYPAWRPGVSRVEVLDARGGALRFREHSSTGALTMEMTEASRPARIVTRIADPDQPFAGTWTFEIAASGGGSTVTITERGEVYNPVFRFVARFVLGHARTIDDFLNALRRRLESAAAG
jgi:uncharacterized protein YndB with AHSA1/START domain